MADIRRLPGRNAELWEWQLLAACRGMPSSYFFHPQNERGIEREQRIKNAKAICAQCPVVSECLAHALAAQEVYGVWGGMSEDDRSAMRRSSRSRPATVDAGS